MSTAEVYQIAQIRELESWAKERFNVSSETMMQRAGEAAFNYFSERWPSAKQVIVVCGSGNNGGDGYVFAKKAHKRGLDVIVLQVGDAEKLKEEAKKAHDACTAAGVIIRPYQQGENLKQVDVIVDAIYGIGLEAAIRYENQFIIDEINKSQVPVLALDVPTGVHADTGCVKGVAIQATATITFIGEKLGLLTGAGVAYAGDVYCNDLQLPKELFAIVKAPVEKLSLDVHYLQPRRRDFYKGDAGHVLIVGGDEGYAGAPLMAALGALRVGAGLVSIATHPKHAASLAAFYPEMMCHEVYSSLSLKKLLRKITVVVIGPGMGQSPWAKKLLKTILKTKLPLVVDADGLNLLADKSIKHSDWILTPHPGEAGRLLKMKTDEIQQDRYTAIQKIQQIYDGVCVLKGAGTLVAAPHQPAAICTAGNPGMGSGGMGDILSGVLGGLLAQGLPLAEAAKLGVFIHATASDMAAAAGGERGMIATDLLPFLRQLVNAPL